MDMYISLINYYMNIEGLNRYKRAAIVSDKYRIECFDNGNDYDFTIYDGQLIGNVMCKYKSTLERGFYEGAYMIEQMTGLRNQHYSEAGHDTGYFRN